MTVKRRSAGYGEEVGDSGDGDGSPVVSDEGEEEGDGAGDNLFAVENVERVGDDEEEEPDEHEQDDTSSEEERNTVGDIPMRWYQQYDHIGYDRDGQQLIRRPRRSILEELMDPSAWRKIYDEKNDEELTLTDRELNLVARIRKGEYATGYREGEDEEETIAWTGDPAKVMPFPTPTEPKRRFLPSKHEAAKVVKIVRAIRSGLIKKPENRVAREDMYNYDVWVDKSKKTSFYQDDDVEDGPTKAERARDLMRVQAPKVQLPGHAESYNPPSEYLPTAEEKTEWEEADPEDRKLNFLPSAYKSLRHVPLYDNFIQERFERCLDLYIATRVSKQRLRIDPEELIPQLPDPDELKPFPNGLSSKLTVDARVRYMDVHRRGQFLLTGDEKGVVRVWDISVMKCIREWKLGENPITCVEWCPRSPLTLIFAASIDKSVYVIRVDGKGVGTEANAVESKMVLKGGEATPASADADPDQVVAEWDTQSDETMIIIKHKRPAKHVTWHPKGDYFAVVARDSSGASVVLHRLSKQQSQIPFRKKTSQVQIVRFHPTRPFFFVASKQHVRVYNLVKQVLVRKLTPGVQWISSLSIHPSGDHLIVGSYDMKLCWFDLDLASTPYKVIRNHKLAIRALQIHPHLPLFADGSDDGSVLVFHAQVYNDLTQNALIVPVKRIENAHPKVGTLSVLDVVWHPYLPWLFTSGADNTIRLFTNIN